MWWGGRVPTRPAQVEVGRSWPQGGRVCASLGVEGMASGGARLGFVGRGLPEFCGCGWETVVQVFDMSASE